MVVVAAKHVLTHGAHSFGGRDIANLVGNRLHPHGPLVRRARVSALNAALGDAIAVADREVTRSAALLSDDRRRVQHLREERTRRRESAVALYQALITKCGEALLDEVRQLDAAVTTEVPDTGFARDNTYENTLNSIVKELNGDALSNLEELLDEADDENGFTVDVPALAARGKKLLPKPDLSITIPKSNDAAVGKGAAGGAAAGAVVGSVVPVVGTLFGALLGGIAGAMAGGSSAVESDKQAASSIRSQLRSHIAALAKRYSKVFATLHDEVGAFVNDAAQPVLVDEGLVSSHEFAQRVRDRLSEALREAQQLLVEYTRVRAFEIHMARNGGPGDEMSDWQHALREVYGRDDDTGSTQDTDRVANIETISHVPASGACSNEGRSGDKNVGDAMGGQSQIRGSTW